MLELARHNILAQTQHNILVRAQHHLLVMTRAMVKVYGESDRARGRQHALVRRRSGNSAHATAPNGSAMNGTCPPRKSLWLHGERQSSPSRSWCAARRAPIT